MSSLQKVNLGTPPTAVDGDTSRGANTKMNSNVDVLNAQAALTSAAATITAAQALTAAHVGKRVNISLAAAGTISMPTAAVMGLDGIIHVRNVGTTLVTLAIAVGSGDTLALTKLNAGEAAMIDSDGVHALGCLLRGRTNADNELVISSGILVTADKATVRTNLGVSRELIAALDAPVSGSLALTSIFTAVYMSYEIEFDNLNSTAAADTLALWFTRAGVRLGAANAYKWSIGYNGNGASNQTFSNGATFATMMIGISNLTGPEGLSGSLKLYKPAVAGNYHRAQWRVAMLNNSNMWDAGGACTYVADTAAIDGLEVGWGTGSTQRGAIRVYGNKL